MDREASLIVFAKSPKLGKVKTRLESLLSKEDALTLYNAFLSDSIIQYTKLGISVRLYVNDFENFPMNNFAQDDISLHQQRRGTLGSKMLYAFIETFLEGFQDVVIIGTDHPSLPTEFLNLAFETLSKEKTIVLGPSIDGGFYLLGKNELYPNLFEGMTYSHDKVFEETLQRATQNKATVNVLPEWYDVDTPQTLIRLIEDLENSNEEMMQTRRIVGKLIEKYPELA